MKDLVTTPDLTRFMKKAYKNSKTTNPKPRRAKSKKSIKK